MSSDNMEAKTMTEFKNLVGTEYIISALKKRLWQLLL